MNLTALLGIIKSISFQGTHDDYCITGDQFFCAKMKTLLETAQTLTPKQRLQISLGFLVFSSIGLFVTYKLEEMYPAPKRDKHIKSKLDLEFEAEFRK